MPESVQIRTIDTKQETGPASRLVDLLDRLLELASDIAPESRSLKTEAYRGRIEEYRSELSRARDVSKVDHVVRDAIRVSEEFFERSKSYLTTRERELRELILLMRDAMESLAGNGQDFHGQMVETGMRLSRLSELEDIRTLKKRLSQEVDTLKRVVEQKHRDEQAQFSELTERVGVLEATLELTKRQATLDELTGVPNRRSLDQTLREWVQTYAETKRTFVLGMVDLDDFKAINDEHGHVVGDRVLRCAASSLSGGVRGDDFVARYGGEEFAVILSDTNLRAGRERMDELVARIGQSRYKYQRHGEDRWVYFTVSAGITEYARGDEPEVILQRADEALYGAKRKGKNCVVTKKKGLLGRLG